VNASPYLIQFYGSGYDIACAQNNTPIIYQILNGKPTVKPVSFAPAFTKIFTLFTSIKQKSKAAINTYQNNKTSQLSKNISAIDQITAEILQAVTTLSNAIDKHEATMSHTLKPYYKESLFSDFDGQIKV
jgi:mevalonate kinase